MWWKFVRTVSEKGRTLTAIFIPINTKNLIKGFLVESIKVSSIVFFVFFASLLKFPKIKT